MPDLIAELAKVIQIQQTAINHLSRFVGAIGASQFLIFRLLMQYDEKLASVIAKAISEELGKPLPHDWISAQQYKDHMNELLKIASNPTSRDEKGRPSWIRLVVDNTKPGAQET